MPQTKKMQKYFRVDYITFRAKTTKTPVAVFSEDEDASPAEHELNVEKVCELDARPRIFVPAMYIEKYSINQVYVNVDTQKFVYNVVEITHREFDEAEILRVRMKGGSCRKRLSS